MLLFGDIVVKSLVFTSDISISTQTFQKINFPLRITKTKQKNFLLNLHFVDIAYTHIISCLCLCLCRCLVSSAFCFKGKHGWRKGLARCASHH